MNTFERTKKHNTKGDRTSLFWRSKKSEKHDGEKVVAMAQSMEGIPEHEKEAMFEKMLDEMNLSEEKKAPLRRRSKEYKEKMLLGFTTAITMPPIGLKKLKDHKMEQPEDYIFDLSAPNPSLDRLTQIIRSLRVALTSNPLTWVHAFGPTGLERILSILDSYNKNDSEHNRIQKECLRCLQKFMNNTVGFKQVLNQDRALSIIAECLNPAKKGVMLEAVKILAPLCLVPEGHSKVLEAITITAEKSQRQRFLLIVEGISKGYEGSGYGSLTLGCLQLINAIISKAHDLEYRMHLRNEFLRTGLDKMLQRLENDSTQDLMIQLEYFKSDKDEDYYELVHKFDNVFIDIQELDDCYDVIKNLVKNTPSENHFLSIMQHLMFIRDDMDIRPAYFKLIDGCVSQIVLHKDGVDPDFRQFLVDTDLLLETITEKEDSLLELEIKINGLRKKVEDSETKRHEISARLEESMETNLNLQKLLKEAEDSIENLLLQNQVSLLHKPLPPPMSGIGPAPPPMPEMGPPPPPISGIGPPSPPMSRMVPPSPPMSGMGSSSPPMLRMESPPPPMSGIGPPPPPMSGMGPPPPPMSGMGPPPPPMPGIRPPPPPLSGMGPPPPLMSGMRPPPPPMPGMGPTPPPLSGMGPPPPPMSGMGPPPPPMPGMGPTPPPLSEMGPPPPPMSGMGSPFPPMPGMAPPSIVYTAVPKSVELPYGLKPKRKWDVEAPTKRANWKTITPEKMTDKSFWIQVKEEELASPEILKGLSDKFTTKSVIKKTTTIEGPSTISKKKIKELKILDGKSAQNISILLGGLLKQYTYEDIKRSILRCDESVLTSSILQLLLSYLPSDDQLKKFQEIKPQYNELTGAEQFSVTISDIKRLQPRLKSLSFKMQFNETINEVKPAVVAAIAACEEIKESKKFAKILELVLLVGNYMNTGSRNAQAFGFEISFLPKLANTKDSENKMTLLNYLASTIETKFPDLISFDEELGHVDSACKISVENIQKTLMQIGTSIKHLQTDLTNSKVLQDEEDKFYEVMEPFSTEAQDQFDTLQKMFKNMEKIYSDLSEFYVFDKQKYSMEELFLDIKTFKDAFIQAHKDNLQIREAEDRARRAKELKEKAEKEREAKKMLVDMNSTKTQEGVMDSLLEALQTGSAFTREQRPKRTRAKPKERPVQLERTRSRTGW